MLYPLSYGGNVTWKGYQLARLAGHAAGAYPSRQQSVPSRA